MGKRVLTIEADCSLKYRMDIKWIKTHDSQCLTLTMHTSII